jgi:serine/threonine-protein kinase RsbW
LAETIIDRVSMTLASELLTVERVEETAERFAQRAGFDEDTVSHISMVCREAAVNAVVHGNQYDKAKHVTASFQLSEEALTIEIADQGPGLDPDSCPDPLAPENLLKTSGRGIFLMRALMDEVHFRQLTPGTQITMIKKRAQKETEA